MVPDFTLADLDGMISIGWAPPGSVRVSPAERLEILAKLLAARAALVSKPLVFKRLDGKAWLIDDRRYEHVPPGVEALYEAARAAETRTEPPTWQSLGAVSVDAMRKAVHREAARWAKRKRCFGLVAALKAVSVSKRGPVTFDQRRPGVPQLDLGI